MTAPITPAAPIVRSLAERIANAWRYDQELNRLELCPNGDDYNALFDLLNGAPYAPPHTEGR